MKNRIGIRSCWAGGVILAVAASATFADMPRLIHFQGKLRTGAGLPVTGTLELRIRLYEGPLEPMFIYDSTLYGTEIRGGLFNVQIGAQTPLPDSLWTYDELWLGLSINGGDELAPRTQLITTPYATRSRFAEDIVNPGSVESVVPTPTVTGITPDSKFQGYQAFTATITGTDFASYAQAKIGTTYLQNENAISPTQMTVTVPAGIGAGTYDVVVENLWKQGTGSQLFTVQAALPGSNQDNPGLSCNAIFVGGYSTGDGLYWIDPNAGDTSDAFQAYCDMTTDGGGWTLVVRIVEDQAHGSIGTVGTLMSPTQPTGAKLSDVNINLLGTELYRFTCKTATDYFDATQRPFIAQIGNYQDAISRSSDTYGGSFCDATRGDGRYGLVSYQGCNNELMYKSGCTTPTPGCNGCAVTNSGNPWDGMGTVYAR